MDAHASEKANDANTRSTYNPLRRGTPIAAPTAVTLAGCCMLTFLTGCPPGYVQVRAFYVDNAGPTVLSERVRGTSDATDTVERTLSVPRAEDFGVLFEGRGGYLPDGIDTEAELTLYWNLNGATAGTQAGTRWAAPWNEESSGGRFFPANTIRATQTYQFYAILMDRNGRLASRTNLLEVIHEAAPECGRVGEACCGGDECDDPNQCRTGVCSVPCSPGAGCTAGAAIGECRNGRTVCGVSANRCEPGLGMPEECNGADDDCDGATDEDFRGRPDPCDGVDNDCDGDTDEDYVPTACSAPADDCPTIILRGMNLCDDGTVRCIVDQSEVCGICGGPGCGLCFNGPCSSGGTPCAPGMICGIPPRIAPPINPVCHCPGDVPGCTPECWPRR